MTGTGRRDLTHEDPLSSAAEGDADPGSAALAADEPDGAGEDEREPTFSDVGPPPEAADPTPVTDVVPGTHLGAPGGPGGSSAP